LLVSRPGLLEVARLHRDVAELGEVDAEIALSRRRGRGGLGEPAGDPQRLVVPRLGLLEIARLHRNVAELLQAEAEGTLARGGAGGSLGELLSHRQDLI